MTKSATELEKEVELLKTIIKNLVMWIVGSANSPLSQREADTLIKMLDSK